MTPAKRQIADPLMTFSQVIFHSPFSCDSSLPCCVHSANKINKDKKRKKNLKGYCIAEISVMKLYFLAGTFHFFLNYFLVPNLYFILPMNYFISIS